MGRRTPNLMAVAVAAGTLWGGSLSAQELKTANVASAPRVAETGKPARSGDGVAPDAVAPIGRRARLPRVYELKRENRALAGKVAAAARVEERLALRLDSLEADSREGERYIATIDSLTEAIRTERLRLEARLRELESLAVYADDTSYAAPGSTAVLPPLAPTEADSARASLLPPRVPPAAVDGRHIDQDETRPLALGTVRRSSTLPLIFYGGLTAGVVAVRAFHMDSDPGGYHDGVRTRSLFPDKAVHMLAAWVITSFGSDLRVGAWKSAAAVCATGVGFELAQGYVSRYDIGANCLGAAGSALWHTWLGR